VAGVPADSFVEHVVHSRAATRTAADSAARHNIVDTDINPSSEFIGN